MPQQADTKTGTKTATKPAKNNGRFLAGFAALAVVMVGAAYASVPLYNIFCKVTGYGGTTQRADAGSDVVLEREIKVLFDASTARGLMWEFKPLQLEQTVRIGENGLARYRATNLSDKPLTGMASYNVTPQKAGAYFVKLECFCFTEQTLQPGESMDMPVIYFVAPEIAEEKRLDDIKTITLSYTFFEKTGAEPVKSAKVTSEASPTLQ